MGLSAGGANLRHQCLAGLVVHVRHHHPGTATGSQASGTGTDAHGPAGDHTHVEALAAILTLPTRDGPLVLVLEDWHWVDDASHEVLRQLSSMTPSFALLVVVTFRPERELDWSRGSEGKRLVLEPLSENAAVGIIKAVLGVARFPADLAHLIYERTGGNPFFLVEIVKTLREAPFLTRDEGGRFSLTY